MRSTAKMFRSVRDLAKQTKGQKLARIKVRDAVRAKNSKMFEYTSKGIGKYVKQDKISRRAYRLEKRALKNEALGINARPEMIKAAGQALAMNIAPSASSYAATAGAGKLIGSINEANKPSNSIGNLIQGGVGQAGLNNEEEDKESASSVTPGGYILR